MKVQRLFLTLLTLHVSEAFTASKIRVGSGIHQRRKSALLPLHVSASLDYQSEEAAYIAMRKARACAFSDSCSLEEAESLLNTILHVQSGCASGTLVGHDVCENQDVAAEIVAGLRAKVQNQDSKELSHVGSKFVGISLAAVVLTMVALLCNTAFQPDVAPFTLQEWWWAARGGYLGDMFQHYMRYGGLSVVDYEPTSVPFTMQEWWWALSGGYLDKMLVENFEIGGLSIIGYQPDTTPITLQEWWWAVTGGFLNVMLFHNFQNGGLLTSTDYQSGIVPFTSEEWMWAAKDGYLKDMAEHYFRNGGM